MVVGDDDQCIYEWTGANPAYIRRRFQETFTHFPHAVYRLSRSFRFGPAIAQTAANFIARNTDREVKELVANEVGKPGVVELHTTGEGGMSKEPIHKIIELLNEGVSPKDMIVLVRNYIQSYELQAALFGHGIPFFVDGERPVVNSFAIRCLRWYLSLACGLFEPLSEETQNALTETINRPPRYVNRCSSVKPKPRRLRCRHERPRPAGWLREVSEGIQPKAFANVHRMLADLGQAWHATGANPHATASGYQAASALIDRIDFRSIFTEFQAEGRVEVNMQALCVFRDLLQRCDVALADVERFARTFDTTLGKPEEACIKITSIFKEKGREYEYVILPQVVEGQMPSHILNDNQATDRQFPERWPVRSSLIESERRLFYVAVTRAKKTTYIFTSKNGQRVSRFVHEAFVPETVAAVNAVHLVIKKGTATASERQALLNAARHGELRTGVLCILRDAMQAAPGCQPAVQSLLPEVLSVTPIPFRYPEAYPDEGGPQPPQRRDVGLPF